MTTELIAREKCRFCHVYLPKGCLNDVCLECSKDKAKWILKEQEKLVKEIYRLRLELYLKFKKPYGNKGYDN